MNKIKKWMVIPYIPSNIDNKETNELNKNNLSNNEKATLISDTLLKTIPNSTDSDNVVIDTKNELLENVKPEIYNNDLLVKNETLQTPEKPDFLLNNVSNAPVVKRKKNKIIPSPKKGDFLINLNSDSFYFPISKQTRKEKTERSKKEQKQNRYEKFDLQRLNDFEIEVDKELFNTSFETYNNNF